MKTEDELFGVPGGKLKYYQEYIRLPLRQSCDVTNRRHYITITTHKFINSSDGLTTEMSIILYNDCSGFEGGKDLILSNLTQRVLFICRTVNNYLHNIQQLFIDWFR